MVGKFKQLGVLITLLAAPARAGPALQDHWVDRPCPPHWLGKAVDLGPALRLPDSYVEKVIGVPGGSGYFAMLGGTGQSCYEGKLVHCDPPYAETSVLLHLGQYSPLSRGGVPNSSPHLVAAATESLFILNVTCGAAFPDAESGSWHTGNVVLYDHTTQHFSNLTRADGEDGFFYRAAGFFPSNQVVLVEKLRLGSSDQPTPVGAPLELICMDLDGRTIGGPSKLPTIASVIGYRQEVRIGEARSADGRRSEWTISWVDTPGVQHRFLTSRTPLSLLRAFAADAQCQAILVSHPDLGTLLVTRDGEASQISEEVAFHYDAHTRTVFLKTMDKVAPTRIVAVELLVVEPIAHQFGPLKIASETRLADD